MIKLFEQYNNSYYKLLIGDLKSEVDEYIPFTLKEISLLKDLFKYITHIKATYYNKDGFIMDERDYLKSCIIYIGFRHPSSNITITKLPDEWYILTTDYKHYKCDQFEGLLKCIEDIC